MSWLSQREGTWTSEKWDAWTAGLCFCSRLPALGCWEHRPQSLPRKSIILLSPISGLLQAGTAPDALCWQERGRETGWAGLARADCCHGAVPLTWLLMPGGQPGRRPHHRALAALEGGDGARIAGDAVKHPRARVLTHAQRQVRMLFALPYRLESKVLPWGPMCHSPHLCTAPSPPSPSPLSWHLAAWRWARGVKSFTLLSPVQKGVKNQHASLPGEQGG